MEKLKDALLKWLNHFNNTDATFDDLDEELRNKAVQYVYFAFGIIIAGIVASILAKYVLIFLVCVLAAVGFLLYDLFFLKDCFVGNIVKVSGVFYEISKPEKHDVHRKFVVLMLPDKSFVKVFVNDSFTASEGNEVAIYTRKNGFRALNDDTILITDPILVKVEKTTSTLTVEDDKKENEENE
jgi:hypothetical protein